MDTDRTDPAMDAGPTIMYAVQAVDGWRDVVEDFAVLYARRVRWIPRKMRVVYHMRWEDTNERVRKGQWRRLVAKAHRENKRLSAMRRQGKKQ